VLFRMGPFECAIHQYAFEYSQTIVKSNPQAIHDGLNLGECEQFADKNAELIHTAKSAKFHRSISSSNDVALTFYVATTGSDSAAGTESAPFATLHQARDAIRKARHGVTPTPPAMVMVRGGKYYFNETLTLTPEDSSVSFEAYQSEKVVLSAGKLLSGLTWKPDPSANATGILVADVSLPKRTQAADTASGAATHMWGAAPAVVNQLFVNGVRQVRARYPNGNPHDTSGMCFSKSQHANEKCNWASAAGGGASQPGGEVVTVHKGSLNRGDSPTKGCGKQCEDYGTFKQTVFAPPDGHPVYTKPLPGIGWQNNSLFSFWGNNLFGRPAELELAAKEAARAAVSIPSSLVPSCPSFPPLSCAILPILLTPLLCHPAHPSHPSLVPSCPPLSHFLSKNWKDPSTGVIHMFHSGLWGGWMYSMNGAKSDSKSDLKSGSTAGSTIGLGYGGYQVSIARLLSLLPLTRMTTRHCHEGQQPPLRLLCTTHIYIYMCMST
jgi:hypothetical protein